MKVTFHPEGVLTGKHEGTIITIGTKTVNNEELYCILVQLESPDPLVNKRRVSTLVPQHFAPGTRLGKWYLAALHHLPERLEDLELDDMLSRRVLVTIENHENTRGEVFPRIVRVDPIETSDPGMVC